MAWVNGGNGWQYVDSRDALSLAWHEAGHAALQSHNAYRFVEIFIRPGGRSDAGAVSTEPNISPTPAQIDSFADLQHYYVNQPAASVAGVVTEYIGGGGQPPLPAFPRVFQYSGYGQA